MPLTAPHQPPSPPSRHLLVRLQLEWDRLSRTPRAVRTARSWGLPVEDFDSLDDLLRCAGYGRGAQGHHDDDDMLADLVRLAHHHQLAARVVLQRLLPGLAAIARRRTRGGSPFDATDEVLASAWTVIRTYPIDRRPRYVAANLLRSIDYDAFRRNERRLTTFVPFPAQTFDREPAVEPEEAPAHELAELLDLASRLGLDAGDLELARRLGRGDTTADLARERAVTDRTIRNHRTAVAHRLRVVALAPV